MQRATKECEEKWGGEGAWKMMNGLRVAFFVFNQLQMIWFSL